MRDAGHATLSDALCADRLRLRLQAYRRGDMRGDHVLNNDAAPLEPWRQAAVLIPLFVDDAGLRVMFTLRTAHLHAHAGQVSFPGGGAEPQDADAIATALRETQEEVGLDPARVQVLGTLDSYLTRTGYQVTPVVGLVDLRQGPVQLTPDEFEVAEIFEVPLTHILSPEALRCQPIARDGLSRQTYVCQWNDYHIWGATAGMLYNLVEAVRS